MPYSSNLSTQAPYCLGNRLSPPLAQLPARRYAPVITRTRAPGVRAPWVRLSAGSAAHGNRNDHLGGLLNRGVIGDVGPPLPRSTCGPSSRLFFARVSGRPQPVPAFVKFTPQFGGISGDHGVHAARARVTPCLEGQPSPARTDVEREFWERGPQPDQFRPHPRRSTWPRTHDGPPGQRQPIAVRMLWPGSASALIVTWWRVVCAGGHEPVRPWICPEPRHSRHERRTHSAWPRVNVPTVQARRDRWNFQPWPRQAGQLSCWASVLRMPPRSTTCRYEPITPGVLTVR